MIYFLFLMPALLALGFWLPGYQLARWLECRRAWLLGFVFSLQLLFAVVFWLGVAGAPLTVATVGSVLAGVAAAATLAVRYRTGYWFGPLTSGGAGKPANRITVVGAAGVVLLIASLAVVTWRSAAAPLSGWDTAFRWDFLARRILALRTFAFYPPYAAEDYARYFYTDSIPPLVSFSYFWIYACARQAIPVLTAPFVVAQYLAIAVAVRGIAQRLHSREAGSFALICLAATPLLAWAVLIGQETGLTAMSLSVMVLLLLEADPDDGGPGPWIAAGAAAACGALAREYGGAFAVCGVLTCAWLRHPWRRTALFVLAVTLLAGPWYLRTWLVTGNPVYSNAVGALFPVNPVHQAMMEQYVSSFGFGAGGADQVRRGLSLLCRYAPLPLAAAGLAWHRWRERGFVVMAAAVVVLLWIYSVGFTSGGLLYSMRMLSPALALLCAAAGIMAACLASRGAWWRRAVSVAGTLAAILGVVSVLGLPFDIRYVPVRLWPRLAARPGTRPGRFNALIDRLETGGRVLTDDVYLCTALDRRGIGALPLWSPEVAFLFDASAGSAAVRESLHESGISHIVIGRQNSATPYFADQPFFREMQDRWVCAYEDRDVLVYRVPAPAANLNPNGGAP